MASLSRVFCRRFSNVSNRLKVDPGTLVYGVTKDRVDTDPNLAEFMLANYPEAFEEDSSDKSEEDDYIFKLHEMEIQPTPYEIRKEASKAAKKLLSTAKYPRNIRPLKSYLRDAQREDGSRNSKRLRYDENMIPGLLCGGDPGLGIFNHQPSSRTFLKTPWNLLQRELVRYRHSFEARVYELTLHRDEEDTEGFETHIVTPENVNRHPFLETIYCANFVRYHPGRPLRLPVEYVNQEESTVLRRDAFIIPIRRHVECFVEDGVDIPEALEVECTGLVMKSVIRKDRVILPEGVRLSDRVAKTDDDFVIGVVYGGGREEEETPAEGESKEEKKK